MNKEIFLKELREYLIILEDREQEDILEEYAQHIDMKMQKGLSEEEAIQDFGPIDELASQILEAYHVKTQFQEKKKFAGFSNPMAKIKDAIAWIKGKCRAFGAWLMKPFRRQKTEAGESTEDGQIKERKTKEMGKRISNMVKATGNGIVSICRACCSFCVWCLKWIWNAGWLLFSALCAFMAMIMLMGFGMTAVLLFQDYPFYGIFVLCLGGMLCFGALAGGAFTLLIRKKKESVENKDNTDETNREEMEESDKEAQYE